MIEAASTRYTDQFHFYSNDLFIGQSIRLYGEYTEAEVQLLFNFIGNDTVVYDIGANIGYHTHAFASKAKHVYAFEPNRRNMGLLRLNTKTLKNVTRVPAACGHEDGITYIGDFDPDRVGNFGKCEISTEGTFARSDLCVIRRIDSLQLPPPGVIKIDVEGLELQVLVGAEQTIVKYQPVIFYEAQHVPGQDQIYRFLVDALGYKLYWYPVGNFNPNNFRQNTQNVFFNGGVVNILAVPSIVPPLPLPPVINDTDTYEQCVARHQQSL